MKSRTTHPTTASENESGKAAMLRLLLPPVYFEHFTLKEYRFRWADIISTDPSPTARMHHAALTIAMRNFDEFGSAHPRVDTIAKGMHVAVGTARSALHDLERHGWMDIQQRDGTTNNYQALLPVSCTPAIVELAARRTRQPSSGPDTLAVAYQVATGLVTSLGGNLHDTESFTRVRGQITKILASAADIELEAPYVIDYVLDELPRTVENPVGLCHNRLAEYHRKFARSRKRPAPVDVDPERRATVQGLLDMVTAALGTSL